MDNFHAVSRYEACLILGAVGDALGFNNGRWEFQRSGEIIHNEVKELGGVEKLDLRNFRVSDDTVMAMATARALLQADSNITSDYLFPIITQQYIECMKDMSERAPGNCVTATLRNIEKGQVQNGYQVPFNGRGGGCGAAMRAVPIGLRFPRSEQYKDLIRVAVESGRITHHHPTGYMGSVAVALFTSLAIRRVPTDEWGMILLNSIKDVKSFIIKSEHEVQLNLRHMVTFEKKWRNYLMERNLLNGGTVVFPAKYGVKERDTFYHSLNSSGWGGCTGIDAPMIAYDALLFARDNWILLCESGMLHGGDSDSTGILAGSWFGLLYGLDGIPFAHYDYIEKKNELITLSKQLSKYYFSS
ncbi:UNVERIFIED_CONTAM: hypothetical protein GTU68_055295 [Idotea baltica]|nr:hypothetical protein [Idotea baltica]